MRGSQKGWYVLQGSVALGVLASDIVWGWNVTNNPMAGLLVSILAALLATMIVSAVVKLLRGLMRARRPSNAHQPAGDQRRLGAALWTGGYRTQVTGPARIGQDLRKLI